MYLQHGMYLQRLLYRLWQHNTIQNRICLPPEAMITWKEFQAVMPWEVALLVGGGFALAEGTQVQFTRPSSSLSCCLSLVSF